MTCAATAWPSKRDVFGVNVTPTCYDEAETVITESALLRENRIVTYFSVHGLATATLDPSFRTILNAFDMVAPDGQPIRWALNCFHKAQLQDRVYGPEMMLRLCARAAAQGIGI